MMLGWVVLIKDLECCFLRDKHRLQRLLFELKKSTWANLGSIFSNARSVFLSCLVVSNILVKSTLIFHGVHGGWCCCSKVQMFIYDHTGERFFEKVEVTEASNLNLLILRRQRRKKPSPTKMTLSELLQKPKICLRHISHINRKKNQNIKNT